MNANKRIVYRNDFQAAILEHIQWYKAMLCSDAAVQEAFIRKFDSLCQ